MTIKEVAELAGVSISTVSRVLNNKNWVDPKTQEKVLKAVQELNFIPNGLARYLGGDRNETGIIGALFASPIGSLFDETEIFFDIILGIGDIADQHEKCLILEHVKSDYQSGKGLPTMIKRNLVDGLIVGGIPIADSLIRDLKKTGIPLVVIGKYKSFPTHRILIDNYGGGYKAAEHLLSEQFKNVAVIAGSLEIYAFADKLSGFKAAFAEHGKSIRNEYIVEMQGPPGEAGYMAMKKLMELKKKPDAIFITDLSMAMEALRYLSEYNYSIPEDVAIVVYGKGNLIRSTDGPMTYIHNGDRNIGRAAARLLFDIIEGKGSEIYDITISTRLIPGKTSLNPRKKD